MMAAAINRKTAEKLIGIADAYPGVYMSVGVHPHDAATCSETELKALTSLAAHPRVRAWGEAGLDFNRMFSPQPDQEKWFVRQIEIADRLDLPMILHERDSGGRFLEIVRATMKNEKGAVVHCFSGTKKELFAYLDFGFHIGITGILTVKGRGAELRKMVRSIPKNRLLIETDAPYLTPTPERNKHRRNEPAFVRSVFARLVDILGEPPESLAGILWDNTCALFGIRDDE